MKTHWIYCVKCGKGVNAELKRGSEVYRNREDLHDIFFWRCPVCGNFVGTHKDSKKHAPLGVIATKEINTARRYIHELIDPLWKSGKIRRGDLYSRISSEIGYPFHTANLIDIQDARKVYKIGLKIRRGLINDP